MSGYNLLNEPFVSCLSCEGSSAELGIKEVFLRSQEIREIRDASPLVTFSVHRFLLAVMHWVSPVADDGDWGRRWNVKRFTPDLVSAVVDTCAGCFDLFDERSPFYQDQGLSGLLAAKGGAQKDSPKPVSYLAPEFPTATRINHFMHVYDGGSTLSLCPACCAKGLLFLPPFCPGVGQGNEASINNVPPVYVLLQGRNLFETLMLNLPLEREPRDLPAWEGTTDTGNIGFLEGVTWQPRRVLLKREAHGGQTCSRCGRESDEVVRRIIFQKGRSRRAEADRAWRDWHVPISVVATKNGPKESALRPRDTPDFWRDLASAAIPRSGGGTTCAPVLARGWLARCDEARRDLKSVDLHFYLFQTTQAAFFLSSLATWRIRTSLFDDGGAQQSLLAALEHLGDCESRLPGGRSDREKEKDPGNRGEKEDFASRIGLARRTFELRAESAYRDLLYRVGAAPPDHQAALSKWRESLREIARETFAGLPSPYAPRTSGIERRLRDARLDELLVSAFGKEQ